MKLGWVETRAFQAFTDGGQELVFEVMQREPVPPEFKEGDDVIIVSLGDLTSNLATGKDTSCYEATHISSGRTVQVAQKTREWWHSEAKP